MNEKILIFDTETIGLEKAFCYNIGWVVLDLETYEKIVKKDYVVKQFWENKPLFETAYYSDKKDIYIKLLRSRKAKIKHYGHIMLELIKDIENYNIKYMYAFNSPFDMKVLNFNCEWFKCSNPLDYVKTLDIRALINNIIFDKNYKDFCIKNNLITPANNLQVNAEAIYKFISQDPDFIEEHTALSDSLIETEILIYLHKKGIDIMEEKKVYNKITSNIERDFIINYENETYVFKYKTKTTRKETIYLKR